MTKLAQLVAVDRGVRTQAQQVENGLYQSLAKTQLFSGLSRTYRPKNDDDTDLLPAESTLVQLKSEELLTQLIEAVTRLVDVGATRDASNCLAKADIVVDGETIASQVPVTTLMSLEKVIENLTTFVSKIPQLDPAQKWEPVSPGLFRAETVTTSRTKKVPRNHVMYEATEQHPAQVQTFTEDILVGFWDKVEFSGALPAERVAAIQSQMERLRTAVKFAREEANTIEVVDVNIGATLLDFIFNGGSNGNGRSPQASG